MSNAEGGRLTTHVLDTASGRPAAGLKIALYRVSGNSHSKVKDVSTNSDGRCDAPLLSSDAITAGRYRLEFDVADYFRAAGVALPDPAFLETVVIAFGIADATAHYHVPLLVSPYAYSTYRGS